MTECSTCGALGNEQHLSPDCDVALTILSSDNLKRLIRLLWVRVGKAQNPWFEAAANDHHHWMLCTKWNDGQVHWHRQLYAVLFENAPVTDELVSNVFKFLDSAR